MINSPFASSLRDDFEACFDLNGLFCCKTWISVISGRYTISGYLLERRAMVMYGIDHDSVNSTSDH